jgi:hypothetical protein
MKSWFQTLMNACINVHDVYIHRCVMYNYGIRNMYDHGEYFQNILLKKSKPNVNNNNNLKSWRVLLSRHVMKNLQSMIRKKNIKNVLYDGMAC